MSDNHFPAALGSPQPDQRARQTFAWYVALSVALIDLGWIYAGGWSVLFRAALLSCLGLFVPLLFRRYRSDLRLRSTLLVTALLIVFSNSGSVLSYLVLSVGRPLADRYLAHWDAAIGFDWLSTVHWVHAHAATKQVFWVAYNSAVPQMGLVVLFLGFTGRLERLNEFVELFMAGSLLAIATSLAFPAAGPWIDAPPHTPFDASDLSNFVPLHGGTMRSLDLNQLQGLISVPSVHAEIGIFLVYAMRATGPLFLLAVVLNGLLLLATPTEGGHYLVDVIAGVLCAALLIVGRRWAKRDGHTTKA